MNHSEEFKPWSLKLMKHFWACQQGTRPPREALGLVGLPVFDEVHKLHSTYQALSPWLLWEYKNVLRLPGCRRHHLHPLRRHHTEACVLSCFRRVRLFVTSCTVIHQAPLSTGFSRQENWSGLPCPLQGIFLIQRSNPRLLVSCLGRGVLYH